MPFPFAPFAPAPFSTSVELNLGLILLVDDRSSWLKVSGELAAAERLVWSPPAVAVVEPGAGLPPEVTSARDSEDR